MLKVLCWLVIGLFMGLSELWAADFTVSTVAELRQALQSAGTNGQADTINIAAGTYKTTADSLGTFTFVTNEEFALVLQGSSKETSILDGDGQNQILQVTALSGALPTVSVQNLSLLNSGDSAGFAIQSNSHLTLDNSLISNSQGGGLLAEAGGITLQVLASVITQNQGWAVKVKSSSFGVAINVVDSVISQNYGGLADGGSSGDSIQVLRSTVTKNHTPAGEIYTTREKYAVNGANVTITDSEISSNERGVRAINRLLIDRSEIAFNLGWGIEKASGGGSLVIITNSIITHNKGYGLGLTGQGIVTPGYILNSVWNQNLGHIQAEEDHGFYLLNNVFLKTATAFIFTPDAGTSPDIRDLEFILTDHGLTTGSSIVATIQTYDFFNQQSCQVTVSAASPLVISLADCPATTEPFNNIRLIVDQELAENTVISYQTRVGGTPPSTPFAGPTPENPDLLQVDGFIYNNYLNLSKVAGASLKQDNLFDDYSGLHFWSEQNYQVSSSSVLINQGRSDWESLITNTDHLAIINQNLQTDKAGKSRVLGGQIDLGAFEFDSTAVTLPVITDFSYTGTLKVNHELTFVTTASAVDGKAITAYHIDWGNGVFVESSPTVSHVFPSAGTFTIRSKVTDSAGETAIQSLSIRIQSLTVADCQSNPPLCGINTGASPVTRNTIETLSSGWHLLGSSSPLTDFTIFNTAHSVWSWQSAAQTWFVYTKDPNLRQQLTAASFGTLTSLPANIGFWVRK